MIAEINSCIMAGVSVFGFSLNFLAFWMIRRHTQPEMHSYRHIMLQTVITDLLTLSINLFVQPVFFFDNGWGTMWSYGPAHFLPNPWQCYSFRLLAFMLRFTSTGICSLFVYRYFLVIWNCPLSFKAYCVLIAAAASPTFVLFVLGLLSNSPTAENEHLTNGALIAMLGLDNATAQRYVVPMRSGPNPLSAFTSSFAMGHTIVSYAIIVLFALAVQWHICRHYKGPSMAVKRQMNRQISVVLGVQASLPLFTFVPQMFTNAAITFNISMGTLLNSIGFFSSTISVFICVLNPIVTLLSVSSYRRILVRWILCCKKENNLTMVIPSKNTRQRAVPAAAITISLPVHRNVVFPRK